MANAMDDILSPFSGVTGPSEPLPPPPVPAPAPATKMPTPSLEESAGNTFAYPSPQPMPVPQPGAEQLPVTLQQPQATPQPSPEPAPQPKQGGGIAFPHLSKEQLSAEEKTHKAFLEAGEAKANLDRDAALAQSMQAQETANQLAKKQAQEQAEAEKIKGDSKKSVDEWQGSIDEYKEIRKKGPEQLSTGQSILAAIAQGLGAFGSAMTGGPNYAMQVINKAADARVRKWEKDLDESRGNIDAKHNAVAFFRQKGMDARAASQAARQAILDDAAQRGDVMMQQYKGEQVQATWQQTKAALESQRQAALNQRSLEEQEKRLRFAMAAQPKAMSVGDQVKLRGLEVEVPQGKNQIATFHAKSEPEAKAIRDAQKVVAGILSDLGSMEALVAGSPTLNPQTSQKVEILNNSIRKKYIKLDELGVPTGKDLELSSVIGDPTSWKQTSGQTRELIGRTREDAANRLMQAYESQGFRGPQ